METAKVAVSINKSTLNRLDNLVKSHVFPSRSRAVQEAIEEKLNRMERTRLARECAKVDIVAEQALADEGISHELTEWPEY
ncbi:putative transcriptional regulator, CopG family [Dehalogenimonas lykanthroporepellens BL-DC-9]|nr:putative transcriptional regulator, CopG family [Dehalogenimonas lykanthroporepellens BL-DC-9]